MSIYDSPAAKRLGLVPAPPDSPIFKEGPMIFTPLFTRPAGSSLKTMDGSNQDQTNKTAEHEDAGNNFQEQDK